MNIGFRLVIHKSIVGQERELCLGYLSEFKERFLSKNSYKTGGWCSHSYYRRGIFGLSLGNGTPKYTFRRLTKGRRIFGVVPVVELERVDGQDLDLDQCVCAYHRGGQRVRLKNGFREQDFEVVFEHGQIKGGAAA